MTIPYDAILIVGFGGPERPRRRAAVSGKRDAGPERPARAASGSRRALPSFWRRQPDQCSDPRPDRRLAAGARPARYLAADLLGKSKLAPDAGGHPGRNGGPWRERALAVVHAAYSSYSSCRQYREDIARAQAESDRAPPRSTRFVSSTITPTSSPPTPIASATPSTDLRRWPARVHLAFTAHSIPISMAPELRLRAPAHRSVPIDRRGASAIAPERWRWSTRAGADGRVIRGSSRISSIISKTYGGVGSTAS